MNFHGKNKLVQRIILNNYETNRERRRFENSKDIGHFYFDKIWRDYKAFSRDEAYEWLANMLNVSVSDAHFGNLKKTLYPNAIYYCQQLLNDLRRLDLDFGEEPITPHYDIEQNLYNNEKKIKEVIKIK